MQDTADYLPSPPSLGSATGATQKTAQYIISFQTEELMRQAAVYSSITDSLVASLLEHIPEENRTKIIQEQVKIMAKASRKGVVWVVAATSNLQLIRWDVALGSLRLQDDHVARARTAPFHDKNLLGPNIKEFDAKTFIMQQQHSLHRGLTMHFKVPKKPAPKAAGTSRLLVHQRLGPPVNKELKECSHFRMASRTNRTRTSPTATTKQQVFRPEMDPTNKWESLSHLKRRLNLLQVPAGNEEKPVGARLAGFAQAWQNLASGRVQVIQNSEVLTRTLRQFLTKNKTEYLQKAMDSLLKKGAIEPVPRSPTLDFFSRLRS